MKYLLDVVWVQAGGVGAGVIGARDRFLTDAPEAGCLIRQDTSPAATRVPRASWK